MLRHVLFDMSLFENESDRANSQKRVLWLLEALTRCNQLYLQQHPDTPLIYQSGIKYIVPEQFEKANTPEVDVIRQYLKKKNAPADVHAALKTISDLTGGGEHFREIPRIIEHGGGDCLPVETLVETAGEKSRCAIGDLVVGDVIRSMATRDSEFATVEKVWERSIKPTVTLFLESGAKLVSSLDHRHMVLVEREHGLSAVERRAEDIKIGDPLATRCGFGGVRVKAIETSAARECVDITTSTGTFWLPESDVITHNCDNVASWRAAELRELGVNAKPYITWRQRPDGGTTYHVIVRYEDGSSEDPSLLLGMGSPGREADRQEEERKLGERMGDLLSGNYVSTFGPGRGV